MKWYIAIYRYCPEIGKGVKKQIGGGYVEAPTKEEAEMDAEFKMILRYPNVKYNEVEAIEADMMEDSR